MNSGSGLVETWIPDGGFEIQRRKVRTSDGGSMVTDCLVAKWPGDDLTVDHPLHRQPCLHRVLATYRHDQIVAVANNYGLLTVTIPRSSASQSARICRQPSHSISGAGRPASSARSRVCGIPAKDGELVATYWVLTGKRLTTALSASTA
jgi:hypothetical protein